MTPRLVDVRACPPGPAREKPGGALLAALAAVLALLTAACGSAGLGASPGALPGTAPAPVATTAATATTTTTAGDLGPPATVSGSCRATGSGLKVLPDPRCTPGALNPAVTAATVGSTICASGWTATVRPPEAVTERIKVAQMRAYGDRGRIGAYEEDHLVPLELGGAPSDPRNLWPEPGSSPNPKDRVESAARRAVCSGRLSLAGAQQAIATDWVAFGARLGVG
ncbi:hypothetical protein K6U06_10125 [Acidiferrimicrobium sp. IK]|uniref:hypothetical protein n=1 Tax=Acidiferrimicrobium sp. IK TaxID=2871700 RepID=UPI0021CB4E10|nr:hypothetical protein [Acidiferrimicrobium sp. IK]MCU4184717.1 hypothetical protein [Acidiferrimicrobium sp. IK]